MNALFRWVSGLFGSMKTQEAERLAPASLTEAEAHQVDSEDSLGEREWTDSQWRFVIGEAGRATPDFAIRDVTGEEVKKEGSA